jgi:hypothetical protein
VETSRLRPRSRQAGGGDRNNLGQTTPDPGRRATQKCADLLHRFIVHRPWWNDSTNRAHTENGLTRLTSRDVSENSNVRIVRAAPGSGFIAVIGPAAGQIFSPDFGS